MIRPSLVYKRFNWLQRTEPFFRTQNRLANEVIHLLDVTFLVSLSLRFPHQNPVYASLLPHTRYMPHKYKSESLKYESTSSVTPCVLVCKAPTCRMVHRSLRKRQQVSPKRW